MPKVRFVYTTGLSRPVFTAARLIFGPAEPASAGWSQLPMSPTVDDGGTHAFACEVSFADDAVGQSFHWGVFVDSSARANAWGIPMETSEPASCHQIRRFVLGAIHQEERFELTSLRTLGANKLWVPGLDTAHIRFAVWAPNAASVAVVFGNPSSGYIDDRGGGCIPNREFQMTHDRDSGVWSVDSLAQPGIGTFAENDHSLYMYKVTWPDQTVKYRTDLWSRCQIGTGIIDPKGAPFSRSHQLLDGTKGCSVVIDPETVMARFSEDGFPPRHWQKEEDFWASEFDLAHPVPRQLEDLVIYELHVASLGYGRQSPGTVADALEFLDHLCELGVNAVELMPMAQYDGWAAWGYGNSHHCAVEYSSGGRDQLKWFVRACHQRGIAVIVDVVYNHFTPSAERSEWQYDSPEPKRNIYYWYEGEVHDYPHGADGGYIDNDSTGFAPRFWEERVRQLFISSAVALMQEFHIDGFRVDQTSSLHAYAVVHADGRPANHARMFGAKFLREWTRTMKLINPQVFLLAEDHSGWSDVTKSAAAGGLGFDAAWYADFYHHLCGDTGRGSDYANLLQMASVADGRPLAMSTFAAALAATNRSRVVYHESHDEAGNSHGVGWRSARTIMVASGRAPLIGETRRWAEARARVAAALTLLSGGVPMFFMGEEVGCCEPYRYEDFMQHREDIIGLKQMEGAGLFCFYRDLLALRRRVDALRGGEVKVLHVHDVNRVLVFKRSRDEHHVLIFASLAEHPYPEGYRIQSDALPSGSWQEVLNSDGAAYGGWNVGNFGGVRSSGSGRLEVAVPSCGVVVFEKVG